MTPTVGRIVHLFPGNSTNLHSNDNGPNDPIAAIITRVWSDDCINVVAFVDGPNPIWVTSVHRQAAEEYQHWDWPEIIPNIIPTGAKPIS